MVTIALEKYDCLWTLHDMWALGSGRDYFSEEELEQEAARSPLRRIFHAAPRGRLTVTAPSQWLAGLASRVTGERAEFVPNPLDVRIFHPYAREAARALWGFSPTQRVSLAVAENLTDERKGMSFLLQAWQNVRQKEDDLLCLVGRLPKNMPTIAGIRFLGTIDSPSRLAMLYSAADLFVHPAEMENAPCVIQESLACGRPVLARPVGGIPEMILSGENGLTVDKNGFHDAWLRLLQQGQCLNFQELDHPYLFPAQAREKLCQLIGPPRGPESGTFELQGHSPKEGFGTLNLRLGGEDNLYHWLIFHLGPLLGPKHQEKTFARFLLPKKETDLQRLSLAALGIREKLVTRTDRVVQGVCSWGFHFYPSSDLAWLYQALSKKLLSCGSGPGLGSRIYISRRDASKRRVANEPEVIRTLQGHGFRSLCPGGIPWPEQIAAFAHADWIVGPHGGAFTNILFAKPGAHLVELFPAEDDQWFFRQIANSVGVRHSIFQGGPNRRISRRQSGFEVDPESLLRQLYDLGMS